MIALYFPYKENNLEPNICSDPSYEYMPTPLNLKMEYGICS